MDGSVSAETAGLGPWASSAPQPSSLTAMIATPLARLPELTSISQAARAVDRSTMPPLQRFSARDGTELAYRHYPARGPASGKIAILVHGSSGSSSAVHALADALAARGVETYAPDIRGHGGSGTRGDIAYHRPARKRPRGSRRRRAQDLAQPSR